MKTSSVPSPKVMPSSDVTKELDALVASGLSQLSLEEREQVLNGIHGVEDKVQEDPLLIKTSIQQFNLELDAYLKRQHDKKTATPAVLHVLSSSPGFIRSRQFLLMFLRAEQFNVTESFHRMIEFFELKLKLFGLDSLNRDISITQDFSAEDLETLNCGYTQLLPGRDSAGRAVSFLLSHKRVGRSCKSIAKSWYYIIMSALEDAATQRNGLCLIKYDVRENQDAIVSFAGNPFKRSQHGQYGQNNGRCSSSQSKVIDARQGIVNDKDYYRQMSKFHESFPIRIMAFHVCYVNPCINISSLFRVVIENYARFDRAKIRFHRGPHMEITMN